MKKSFLVFALFIHCLNLGFTQKPVEQKDVNFITQKKPQTVQVASIQSKPARYTFTASEQDVDPSVSSFKLLFQDATHAFQLKQYAECLEFCDYMLAMNRNSAEAYFLKGASLHSLGKITLGIHILKIAAEKGSKQAEEMLRLFDKRD